MRRIAISGAIRCGLGLGKQANEDAVRVAKSSDARLGDWKGRVCFAAAEMIEQLGLEGCGGIDGEADEEAIRWGQAAQGRIDFNGH